MVEVVVNPLPILLGWDSANSGFRTSAHESDVEANRQSFPFLYDDLDQPEALKTSAEALQRNANVAIQQYYQSEDEIDPLFLLKLLGHWNPPWFASGLDSAFVILAAHNPELVIRLHVLLKELTTLKDVDEDFPKFELYNPYSNGNQALCLLHGQTLLTYPHRWEWNKVFNIWRNGTLSQLRDRVAAFESALQKPRESWTVLLSLIESLRIEVPLGIMEQLRVGVDATFGFFDGKVQECRNTITTLEKEEQAKLSLVPEPGIFKTPSMSSAIEVISIDMNKLRPRTGQSKGPGPKKLQKKPPQMGSGGKTMASRSRSNLKEPKLWRTLCFSLVTWLVVVSVPFTVLSTFLCEAPDGVPMYDSNFHSTLSQQLLGFGGLYAIVKPQLMQWFSALGWFKEKGKKPPKGIETKWPITFNCLVSLAFVTLLASAPVYPYYPQSSIPLGAVAAICANLATLLIIEDTGSQIVEQVYKIEEQYDEISELNHELQDLRGRA
ncbi:uncharacterized protein BDZ83DRAFT_621625 [Colletotrichum acutatum]|uniref:Uncharacterized protein n=1 Tax=Glomerella acutata TaxID=27357 RepID=A0AAD8UPN2_GLOAC|nr:uncharacterized protein BDZ83DRAFT_621625 [Colletotrichum acutatum]KAK1724899.1 hypothetical protein BDZ83DRAFT_621625 [Colletotrichum acutatum]